MDGAVARNKLLCGRTRQKAPLVIKERQRWLIFTDVYDTVAVVRGGEEAKTSVCCQTRASLCRCFAEHTRSLSQKQTMLERKEGQRDMKVSGKMCEMSTPKVLGELRRRKRAWNQRRGDQLLHQSCSEELNLCRWFYFINRVKGSP